MHDTASSAIRRPQIGSMFPDGGLDLDVEHATGGETIWFSETNAPIVRVFALHWPDTSNLGDISTIDWGRMLPVDIIFGGYPCKNISTVSEDAGLAPGTRSGSGRSWPP